MLNLTLPEMRALAIVLSDKGMRYPFELCGSIASIAVKLNEAASELEQREARMKAAVQLRAVPSEPVSNDPIAVTE